MFLSNPLSTFHSLLLSDSGIVEVIVEVMKMIYTNKDIARLLRKISAAYTLKNENRFKIIAYDKAADAIEHATSEVKDLWEEGKMEDIPGVGKSIASHLDELFRTGKAKHFEDVMKGLPEAIFPLLDIPGFGPKKAFKLVTELKLTNSKNIIEDLKKKATSGEIAKLEGFGEKSEQDVLQRIGEYSSGKAKSARMLLPYASELADRILSYMKKCPEVGQIEPLGSLRRQVATIGDIDIAVASNKPEKVIDWFSKYPHIERIIEKGPETSSILTGGGKQVDLMVQPTKGFGALLQHFTGSKHHNIHLREYALKKGMSLSEHGIKNQKTEKTKFISDEVEFYKTLGLAWIPPEMREDRGEIELSKDNALPKLVELNDIKGDLHMHSDYNLEPSHDLGRSSIKELLEKAKSLGYEYIGISDHNPSMSNHTNKQIVDIMKRRAEKFENIRSSTKSTRVHFFTMMETDILTDGRLALPDEVFPHIDAMIVSLHSRFEMPKEQMTKRVLNALSHPKVKIWGHPTGRLLQEREGADVDWDKIFDYCQKHNIAVEVNSSPQRLDLPDALVHQAIMMGVKITIDTDSHEKDQMTGMRYGVSVARRGWAKKSDVVNALEYNRFREWIVGK